MDDQAVQILPQHDLASEAAARLPLGHEFENVPLVAHGFADRLEPLRVDHAMAGGTGAAAAALGADAGDAVVYRAVHHRGAGWPRVGLPAPVRLYENDDGHGSGAQRRDGRVIAQADPHALPRFGWRVRNARLAAAACRPRR